MKISRITPIALALLLGVSGTALAQNQRDRASSGQDYRGDDVEEVRALDQV